MDTAIKKIFLLVLISLFLPLVSSGIIGGEVIQSSVVSPSWQKVFIYNINDVSNYKEVQVSPDGYRYSFTNSKFNKSLVLRAEILDFQNGFMAGPVYMNLSRNNNKYYSCTDCDIFSKMEFREVIQLKKPLKELIISPEKNFTLKMNVYDDCDTYLLEEKLCERGCDYNNSHFAKFGKNNLNLITDCKIGQRFKSTYFPSSQDVIFQKYITSQDFQNSIFKITLIVEKSANTTIITDFIPKEFTIFSISDNGLIYEEDGYYSIEWNEIEGSDFEFTYFIKPSEKIKSCEFGFQNEEEKITLRNSLENESMELEEILKINNKKFYFLCNFSKELSFQMIESAESILLSNTKVKNNKISKVKIKVGTSQGLENIEFIEYVPKEFMISQISSNGFLESSNKNYNMIIWNFSGSEKDFEFSIKPTESGSFFLMSELGGNLIGQNELKSYNYVEPIKLGKSSSGGWSFPIINSSEYKYEPKNFSRITKQNPIIKEKENIKIAFYSKIFKERAAFDIFEFIYDGKLNRSFDYIKSYSIETNMNSSSRASTKFEYKVNKSFLEENEYKNIKFFTRKNRRLSPMTGGVIASYENEIMYGFESNESISEFFIFAEKNKLSLWDRIMSLLVKLFKRE